LQAAHGGQGGAWFVAGVAGREKVSNPIFGNCESEIAEGESENEETERGPPQKERSGNSNKDKKESDAHMTREGGGM